MNYELLGQTIALFWDRKDNFYKNDTQDKIGVPLFKSVYLIESLEQFEEVMNKEQNLQQKFLFFIHLFHNENNRGVISFAASKIHFRYPSLNPYYLSSAPKKKLFGKGDREQIDAFPYDNFHEKIGNLFKPQTKSEILNLSKDSSNKTDNLSLYVPTYFKVDYAIITALYKDEFEEVVKLFDWDESSNVITETKVYKVGSVKGMPDKKIVAAIPSATGMVDSAIIATQMIEFFHPDFLIMTGVCGGASHLNFGDIVLAKKIFMFQKGKLSDIKDGAGNKVKLYTNSHIEIDYNHLYDSNGNQIIVSVEKFQIELDALIPIDNVIQDSFEPKQEIIKNKINDDLKPFNKIIDIHFESMACSTMVINKDGFFDENIKIIDRKTVAVEMESYGVARACQFANNGNTKAIVFKSVMDNTTQKDDTAKRFAAYTSAQFLKYLIHEDILK